MILEIKGFAIPINKICSISPIITDDKRRFVFDVELDNANKHRLTYTSAKEADTARLIAIKALEGETIDIAQIMNKADYAGKAEIAEGAIKALLEELGVKDVVELKKKIK